MAKRTEQEITKIKGDPNWLSHYVEKDTSLAGMDEYRVLPRMKVIQSMSDQVLKKQFGEGSIIVRPGDVRLWKDGDEPFLFVPLFFCVEFAKWADLKDKTSGMIVERSYDPTSEIAKKSRNRDQRFEPYDPAQTGKDAYNYRYVEHLRFYGLIYGEHPLKGQYVALSFERGEFNAGRNFISAVKMRKVRITAEDGTATMVPVPLWSQVWGLRGAFRDRGDKKWYGIDFVIPDESIIDPALSEEFLNAHTEMKELFNKQRLIVDDRETDGVDEVNSKEF